MFSLDFISGEYIYSAGWALEYISVRSLKLKSLRLDTSVGLYLGIMERLIEFSRDLETLLKSCPSLESLFLGGNVSNDNLN